MSKSALPVEEFQNPKIDLPAALVTLTPMLLDHDASKKESLTRRVFNVNKAMDVADIELEAAHGWLVTKKVTLKTTAQKQKPFNRLIENRPGMPQSWSLWV